MKTTNNNPKPETLTEADIPQLQEALVAALRTNNYPAVKALTVAMSTIDPESVLSSLLDPEGEWYAEDETV